MKFSSFILIVLLRLSLDAQSHLCTLHLEPTFNNRKISLNTPCQLDSDQIIFTKIKFYISKIEWMYEQTFVCSPDSKYHLVDLEDPKSLIITATCPDKKLFNRLKFDIGVDSATNVSGVSGNDLDPIHGMYWTWQSGYINIKIEGTSTRCITRNRQFEFHLGGYQLPYPSLQNLEFPVRNPEQHTISIALDEFFSKFDLKEQAHVMSPGEPASRLSKFFAGCFKMDE